jgi:hypothetical protein
MSTLAACGKKGPPLAPLRPVPGPVTELKARRAGHEVRFTFKVPLENADKTTPVSIDRLEVYAVTVSAGADVPANRDLLTPKYLIATIPVRPAAPEGEAAEPEPGTPEKKADPRPAPGEEATFVEELNEAKMKPQVVALPVKSRPDRTAKTTTTAIAAAWTAAMAAAAKELPVAKRVYVIRGRSSRGQAGQAADRVTLPLTPLPAAPTDVTVTFTETSVGVTWMPPPVEGVLEAFAPPPVYNLYAGTGTAPLNPAPLTVPSFERPGVSFGSEECFVVRSAVVTGNLTIESPASPPACVTPADTFAPAAPKGFTAVAAEGAVNLFWDANTESDLAGYLVLRGEVPGDTLAAITPTPITSTTYSDKTATPGRRYIYVVVAVDSATPPNTSPQSNRVEETAR